MPTQLLFDLMDDPPKEPIHFCEAPEIETIEPQLIERNCAVLHIDGSSIHDHRDLYRAFSIVFRKPKGWYGDEEYAPNPNAFLEYLDDVEQWIPAASRIVVISGSEQFWRDQPRLAGFLVEMWQFATHRRGAKLHLVFAWGKL